MSSCKRWYLGIGSRRIALKGETNVAHSVGSGDANLAEYCHTVVVIRL